MPTIGDLRQKQSLPLEAKVIMTKQRIREWYNHFNGDVSVSFSGGKDSTVLAHLVHELYPDVPLVFSNTGLEYPEIQAFAKKMGAEFLRPKMMFSEVISKYGYPIISKEVALAIYYARRIHNGGCCGASKKYRDDFNGLRVYVNETKTEKSNYNKEKWLPLCNETQFMISQKCCSVMKKSPMQAYLRKSKRFPFIGTLAEESKLREQAWFKHGCNAFESKKPTSQPMSFWTEQDVLHYIRQKGIEIASVYGDIVGVDSDGMVYEPLQGIDCKLKCTGCDRTGCIFCCFGFHLEKGETRFQRLAKTHPKQYEYCMRGGNG